MHLLETLSHSIPRTRLCRLEVPLLLLLLLGCATSLPAADPYAEALDRRVADLESGLKEQERERAQGHQNARQGLFGRDNRWWAAVVVVVVALAARFEIQSLNRRFTNSDAKHKDSGNSDDTMLPEFTNSPAKHRRTGESADTVLLEERSIQDFYEELRTGPTATSASALPDSDQDAADATASALSHFFGWAPAEGSKLQALFRQASCSDDGAARQQALLELSQRLRSLCYGCRVPQLRPIWQMAFGLEGLTRRLAREPSEVTASTLQTVAGAVDLLHDLCADGLKLDSATQPPARFLVVDDDAVSRFAVAASLKKAFDAPDLAPDAETGLALATKQVYNAIFLDVEMPGMDGFELCKRIRQTACNPTTPVVFVTRHCDFDSRAKAALSGGQYLLGKPFLALEITVKALTLVWRSRQPILETEPARGHGLGANIGRTPVVMSKCTQPVTDPQIQVRSVP
jgi:CheY-like chemotaxis protein